MSGFKTWEVEESWIHMRCGLGEGPSYSEETNEFRWLDIAAKKIHSVDTASGPSSIKTISTEHMLGVTADVEGVQDKLIAAAKHGFASISRDTGEMKYIARVYDADGAETVRTMRMNDGAVDSRGRLWAGGITDTVVVPGGPKAVAALWRLDRDGSAHKVVDGVAISNGIAWNCADTILYHTDSDPGDIFAYDFDAESGAISNRRTFFHWNEVIDGERGLPDGLVTDQEDCLWSALYYGYKVIRISPTGEHIGTVRMPAPCITAAVFLGGTELAITSASNREKLPTKYGGSVFKVDVGVKGRKRYKFKPTITL